MNRPRAQALALCVLVTLPPVVCSRPQLAVAQAVPAAPKLTKPPRLVHFVQADWPAAELARKDGAVVLLRLSVDAMGLVTAAEVIESAGAAFDAAAVAAARQFRFEPAELDHKPAPVRVNYRYRFVWKELPRPATLVGKVRDAERSKPLAGVRVAVDLPDDATRQSADPEAVLLARSGTDTDAAGQFTLGGIPPGSWTVRIGGGAYPLVRVEEVLAEGERKDVRYRLLLPRTKAAGDDDDYELVVKAPPVARQTVATAIEAGEAARVPGGQGDVLKVVEAMPGVARAAVGSGEVVVWGSAPGESRTYMDGVPVPRLYHQGGLRSVLHSDLVADIALLPGAYSPQYGRGLGGVLAVQTKPLAPVRPKDPRPWSIQLGADPLEAAAAVRHVGEATEASVSGRWSWLHEVAAPVLSDEAKALFPLPQFRDLQVRAGWRVGGSRTLDLTFLHSDDQTVRGLQRLDPAENVSDARTHSWQRLYARFRQTTSAGSAIELTPWLGWSSQRLAIAQGAQGVSRQTTAWSAGLRGQWRHKTARWLELAAGVDLEVDQQRVAQRGAASLPAREGDITVFGMPLPEQLAADRWRVVQLGAAPWLTAVVTPWGKTLQVAPGLRLDPLTRSVSRKTPQVGLTPAIGAFVQDVAVEPRVDVTWQPWQPLRLRAAWGLVTQAPGAEDLSSVFGNPLLRAAGAEHQVVGVDVQLRPLVRLEATAFRTAGDGLAVRSPLAAPRLAAALVGSGQSRSQGLQVVLRQNLDPKHKAGLRAVSGWLGYTLSKAERRSSTAASWRLSDFDQTHLLTAAASWVPLAGLELGVRFRLASGAPRTPVVGALHDTLRDRYFPVFGRHNADRLPTFAQLDVSARKRWPLGPQRWLEAYLEVLNATNQKNAEEFAYSADFGLQDVWTGLPITPLLGLRAAL